MPPKGHGLTLTTSGKSGKLQTGSSITPPSTHNQTEASSMACHTKEHMGSAAQHESTQSHGMMVPAAQRPWNRTGHYQAYTLKAVLHRLTGPDKMNTNPNRGTSQIGNSQKDNQAVRRRAERVAECP